MAEQRSGRLIVVATPIGNLEDLSPRARRSLTEADAIFCEDTRVTAKLAARFGLAAERVSAPGPREKSRIGELLRRLAQGEAVALVCDAGTPLLSDPGEHLVAAAAAAGYPVLVVPGPSAPAAALAVCGLPAVPHFFLGFLPARAGERRRALEKLRRRPETLVWFEAPHRLVESLQDAADVLGPRRACVARELTKIHEETVRGTLPEIAAIFRARAGVRGESTVVVEGEEKTAGPAPVAEIDGQIETELAVGTSVRTIARDLSRRCGRPAREIYKRALELARRQREGGNRNGEEP